MDSRSGSAVAEPAAAANTRKHNRNFLLLALHQAIIRTGWIFKTESVVMPAVLDTLGGAAWLRGCLPMLNRLGQSVPPLFFADMIRRLPRKRFFLAGCSAAMGAAFLLLAVAWRGLDPDFPTLLTLIFIGLYTLFFVGVGLQQVALGTLTGKLVPVHYRGSLMTISNFVGGVSAILCAWFLLRPWMAAGRSHFVYIFIFAGAMFVLAMLLAFGLREPPQSGKKNSDGTLANIERAFLTAWRTPNYRLLVVVCLLYGMSITLFPHYQSLGRVRLSLGLEHVIPWLIAQNIGVTLFSFPVGWIADRLGNRLALRGLFLLLALTPPVALIMSALPDWGVIGFWLVFLMLGLFPITIRVVSNYALEIAPQNDQANYLSVVNLAMSLPAILFAPLVGWLIDLWGFEFAFLAVDLLVVLAFVLTPRLTEPRHQADWLATDLWKDSETEA